jgi:hypothetical protein
VRLYAVSISSSLARRSLICLSIFGFPTSLPLLRTSLSSRSGDCLSLLGGMENFSFSATESKEIPALIPQLTQPHSTEHDRSHRIPFHSARRTPRFFYSPNGKYTPTDSLLLRGPPSLNYRRIRTRGLASSLFIAGFSNPQDSICQSMLNSSSLYWDFSSIATSLLAIPSPRFFQPRYLMRRNINACVS